jgi:FkbM family methyltransferase
LNTPVLFLIFNRPELTLRVFDEIRKAQPGKLFIAADGPRKEKEGEAEKCEQTRSIVKKIDWQCEVKTLFRDKNLGCRDAVNSAITWFFKNVEEGIILEDDCLPDQSFFTFCQTMLEKHRNNEKIMHIGGVNFQDGQTRGKTSYYFSNNIHIWGWATWKRAWDKYSLEMNSFEEFKKNNELLSTFKNKTIADYHLNNLQKTYNGEIDTWDYQWMYAIWKAKAFSIVPNKNLVTNIGFGADATHTKEETGIFDIPAKTISGITHPSVIKINDKADEYTFNHYVQPKANKMNPWNEIKNIIPAWLKKFIKLNLSKKHRSEQKELTRLNLLPRFVEGKTVLWGKDFYFVDANTFLYGKEEIINKEIYKFSPDTNSPLIIDCGSNIGLSIVYFKKLFPNSRVMSFEPDEKIFETLAKNVRSFNLQNVDLRNEAVWIENGSLEFRKEGGFSGRLALPGDHENIISVKTKRLKDLLKSKTDFLKLDIEGAEYDVIKDCEEELKNISFLFIEYHSHKAKEQTLGEILEILRNNDFRYFIDTAFVSKHPFFERKILDNMDLQLNIFAVRNK